MFGICSAEVKTSPDFLDMTCIHPESYEVVKRVVDSVGLNLDQFQDANERTKFQERIKAWSKTVDLEKVCRSLDRCAWLKMDRGTNG